VRSWRWWQIALCLCGTIKYAGVKTPTDDDPDKGMDMAQQCVALCKNYLGEADEQKAITDALFPPLERFDASASGAEAGFVELWSKMHLESLFGFPLWVRNRHSNRGVPTASHSRAVRRTRPTV
jgi:hypothetical protein